LVTVAAVASCTRVTDGHARLAMPKVGEPIAWDKCATKSGASTPLLDTASCGKLAVPIDYADPDGERASLFVIKFPATGNKIGSLVINPGGPGESGVDTALALAQSMPDELRGRFDLVGFDPRGVARSRPALWCNSDADNDLVRTDPMVDYSPAG